MSKKPVSAPVMNSSVPSKDTLRRNFLRSSMGLGLSAAGLAQLSGAPGQSGSGNLASSLQWQERLLMGFGTQLSITAAHFDQGLLARALDASVARLRHIESVMSLFLADSQVSQLNRAGHVLNPDADLMAILQLAQSVSQRSAGAFDVTVQPLWTLWRQSSLEQRLPSEAELREAQSLVAWQNLEVRDEAVRFKRAGMCLTLNGIAQGYACDQARAELNAHGIEHALLDLGEWSAMGAWGAKGEQNTQGEWHVKGAADHKAPEIGIAHPRQDNQILATVKLDSHKPGEAKSLATSSDAQMSFSKDHRNHHIFNPRTGASPAMAASVSVVAQSCALADALTKVFFMQASKSTGFDQWVDRSKALCREWDVQVVLADKAGSVWSNVLG
jgi:FAD:protein FMN transferase